MTQPSIPTRTALAVSGDFPGPAALAADMLLDVTVTTAAATAAPGTPLALRDWPGVRADSTASGLVAPFFHVYVPSNRRSLNRFGDMDTSFVYVGAYGPEDEGYALSAYDIAQDMQRQVRDIFGAYRDSGGRYKAIDVFSVTEAAGPTELPQRQAGVPDRLVETGWTWKLRRHRGATVMPD